MHPAVSNKGRYRSYSGKISKGQFRKQDGRYYVSTNARGKSVTYVLARLVKIAFHGMPDDPSKIDVGHLDDDKTNNELSNLAWQTHRENMQQAMRDPKRNQANKPTSKEVQYRRKGTVEWQTYPSSSALGHALGYKSNSVVSEIANGNRDHSEHEVRWVPQPDLEGEEWRDVEGYKIRISNMGRIEYTTGKRDYGSDIVGYKAYQGRAGFVMAHDLVMRAFVGPRPEGADIDHIDGNKHNNRLANLQYVTRTQNNAKRVIDHRLAATARGKPVLVTKNGVTTRYESNSSAARALGMKQSNVAYNADRNRLHGGYLFGRDVDDREENEEWVDLTDDVLAHAKR